ncbi:hypothetical protein STHU_18690 [Allostella humosa]|nr:hypothetical protein STHU_18690 [Stella humosa]
MRGKRLPSSWLHSRYGPFWQVTGKALDFALETLGLPDNGPLRDRPIDVYLTLGRTVCHQVGNVGAKDEL